MKNLVWPVARLGEALQVLSSRSSLGIEAPGQAFPPPESADTAGEWLEAAAQLLGIEVQPVETSYASIDDQLRVMGPALVRVRTDSTPGFLALLPGTGTRVVAPDLTTQRASRADLHAALCGEMEKPLLEETERLLDRITVSRAQRPAARSAILRERLGSVPIGGIWLLRHAPSASFAAQLKLARVPQRLLALGAAHLLQYVVWILAWWVVGSNVLNHRADSGWLSLWALLLMTLVPLRLWITWLQGLVAIAAGSRLKQRLFFGALRLDPDSLRHRGVGQLLGSVLESEAVEALALSGGFLALVAVIELVVSLFVLGAGAGGLTQSALLLFWLVITAGAVWICYRRTRAWTTVRLDVTHDLVESLVGHRTRLAQLAPDRWHEGEDEALEKYLQASRHMDRSTAALLAVAPRGWLVLALASLAPVFVQGTGSAARIAVAVGGMLLAFRGLRRLASGAWQLTGAAIAWERVGVLYRAATRSEAVALPTEPKSGDEPVLEADRLAYQYAPALPQVLRNCSLRISPGDRLVLEGPSGGGKSTLAALLVGLREPSSGQLESGGFPRAALGAEGWRKRIASAPQFHENHVLAETFAFNLLMGKRGALGPRDLPEAEAISRELGLGDLLRRMPAGMLQMVGETGWQLSHGERSRVYIARALLQNAELIILDESFAALDPENLHRALECVVRRARTLLVISHR